jgi:hypothetical protein
VGANEAFQVAGIGLVEHVLSLLDDHQGHALMENRNGFSKT